MKTNRQLQEIAKICLNQPLETKDEWNIGMYLIECNDLKQC